MTQPIVALGLMSGTSMDGIDAALIETDGETVLRRGPGATAPYGREVRALIEAAVEAAAAAKGRAPRTGVIAEAEEAVTRAHAAFVRDFLAGGGASMPGAALVGFHGQTVLHRPGRGFTLQLGDGQLLADLVGIPVVHDFRSADMAAGGQGAPLAPVYHRALAREAAFEPPLAAVNIGGVSNVTWIGADGEMIAFDSGPGNALIDEWARRRTGEAMDRDGALAGKGTVDETAVAAFLQDPFFEEKPPKSLDRNDFTLFLVEGMGVFEAAATLTAITAECIAHTVRHLPEPPRRWVITGGGAANPVLMSALRERLDGEVVTAAECGWSPEFMEAEAFAYMAVRSRRGLPLTFPGTTGVAEAIPGGVRVSPRKPEASEIAEAS